MKKYFGPSLFYLFCVLSLLTPNTSRATINADTASKIQSSIQSLQIPFTANHGQMDEQFAFSAKTLDGTLFVSTGGELLYRFTATDLHTAEKQLVTIKEQLVGAHVSSVDGLHPSLTRLNYFRGADPDKWITGVNTFMDVSLGEVYDSIELRLKAHGNNVEKLFYVSPGGLPEQIQLKVSGADSLEVTDIGQLLVTTGLGAIAFTKPVAWQEIDGVRVLVNIEYKLLASTGQQSEYTFALGAYNPAVPLTIDPLLASTFICGIGAETPHAIALDSEGYVYIAGETSSSDFPTNTNDTSHNDGDDSGDTDVFVSKLSPDMTTLVASTFIGGANADVAYSLAIDANDAVYITGATASPGFPATAYDDSFNNPTNTSFTDVFISKLSTDLSSLTASTFIGGGNSEEGKSIGILSGYVYVTGSSSSFDFPTTGVTFDSTHNGSDDVFAIKLPTDLSLLSASTFIGGADNESGNGLSFDSEGALFITGSTTSFAFPSTTGMDFVNGGGKQVFIAKLPSDFASLTAASVITSNGTFTIGHSIQIDSNNNVFITGVTDSTTFPTTANAFDRVAASQEIFVTKLNNPLNAIMASTFLGGGSWDVGLSLVLDDDDNVYVTGHTNTVDFPTTAQAYDTTHGGGDLAFVTKFSTDLSALLSSTLLGGAYGTTYGQALARDASGDIYVTGNVTVVSENFPFPTTTGAYDETGNTRADRDVFVSRFDSELSGPSLQFGSASYTVNEDDSLATITVTRLGGSNGPVSVDYSSSDGTAEAGSDYTAVSDTLNWADGDVTDKTFTVPISPDTFVEGGETILLNLSNAVGIGLAPPQSTVLNIVDGETPGILQFSSAVYSVDENGGTASISVTRIGGSDGIVSVDYSSSDDTAIAGAYYLSTSGTLTWADGDTTTKSFDVTIINNGIMESDKSLNLSLDNPTGFAVVGPQSSATLTINDDEVGVSLQFSQESFPVMEDIGQATISVTRTGDTSGAVSVEYYTQNDTAEEGEDYTVSAGTLNWGSGDTTAKTFSVPIINDSNIEGEEKITLTLHNQSGSATLGVYNVANINISDDDDPSAQDTLQFSMSSYSVSENGTEASITVTRSNSNAQAVSVQYATSNGSATAGADYTSTSGTLNWAAYNSGDKTFTVPINDDGDIEGGETVTLTLSNPTGGADIGSTNPVTLTILDNDIPTAEHGTIKFNIPAFETWENDGSFDVAVFRVNGSDGEVSVNFATSNNTAIAGEDYDEMSGSLTWADGDGDYKTFTVTLIDNSEHEDDELINLSLSDPTGGAVLGTQSTAVLKIMDNDASTNSGTLQFSAANYSVDETGLVISISVTRTGGSYGYVSVDYATSDITAEVGGDYHEMSGSLDWDDGNTDTKSFEVTIIDNEGAEEESGETFGLSLSNPFGAALGSPQNATVTIVDDEYGSPDDTIRALEILVGQQPSLITTTGDVDGDGRIGMAEAIHALQQSAQ